MSRIGKKPVTILQGVKVNVTNGKVMVEGTKGKLELLILEPITVSIEKDVVLVKRPDNSIPSKVKQGTVRSLIDNMINGVAKGFSKKLLIEGVGFKANSQGKKITLNLGFTHQIELEIPQGLTVKTPTATEVDIEGPNKELVGLFAAKIRSYYEPEPYKGKGVRYSDEVVRRKAGKSVAK